LFGERKYIRTVRTRRLAILISAVYLLAMPVQAELIFQPKKGKKVKEWREAGSNLFTGIARIFDGLAAVERQDSASGRHFISAMESLDKATTIYANIAEQVAPAPRLSLNNLTEKQQKEIRPAFEAYRVTPPTDEHSAAETAVSESKGLADTLRSLRERIGRADAKAVDGILERVLRVEVIGTNTARLMELIGQTDQ
jgi:hypothetical protein